MRAFAQQFGGASWAAWGVFLRALFAIPLSGEDLAVYQRCTGRERPPAHPVREIWAQVGRRGGKSIIAALIAVFAATCRVYRLAPGETPVVMVVATDRRQAQVIRDYVAGLLHALPVFARLIAKESRESIALTSGVLIEVHACSFRSTRGFTIVAAVADEVAFWPSDDAAEPDSEILNAIRPAMATVAGALLLCLSTPYARRGELFAMHERYWGKDDAQDRDGVLVWQADTRTMNPTIAQTVVDGAYARDPEAAGAEYGAQFRADLESLFTREGLEPLVVRGRRELPPVPGVSYVPFVDPSGSGEGPRADSFTMAICHNVEGRAVVDRIVEIRPPFSPAAAVEGLVGVLRDYGIAHVIGDRYAGAWVSEAFEQRGIQYTPSALTRSELYLELLARVSSGRVELPDHPRLLAQLTALDRRTGRSGRDTVDHRPGAHDDVANVVAGCVSLCSDLGLPSLPAQTTCYRAEAIGQWVPCYLFANAEDPYAAHASYIPSGDGTCRACPSHRYVVDRWRQDNRGMDLRQYRAACCGDNNLTRAQKLARAHAAAQDWANRMAI